MIKPVDLDELFLRIGALLRRAKIASSLSFPQKTFTRSQLMEFLMLAWNHLFSIAMKFMKREGRVSVNLKTDRGFAVVPDFFSSP